MTRTIVSHAFVGAVAVLLGTVTETRTQDVVEPHITLVKAAKLLDIRKGNYVERAAVLIDGQRIKEAGAASAIEPHAGNDAQIIDLGNATHCCGWSIQSIRSVSGPHGLPHRRSDGEWR